MKSTVLVAALAIFTFASNALVAQTKSASGSGKATSSAGEIKWISLEEAEKLNSKSKTQKKVFVDVYTDWCGWCKVMDKNTFKNEKVAAYVNQKFYAVKLDAEQREPITLGQQKFEFVPQGQKGYHQLAAALMNGQMSYPTTVFLDEKLQMIQPIPGYMDAAAFHQVATFIGDDHYKKQQFEKYKAETYPKLFAKK